MLPSRWSAARAAGPKQEVLAAGSAAVKGAPAGGREVGQGVRVRGQRGVEGVRAAMQGAVEGVRAAMPMAGEAQVEGRLRALLWSGPRRSRPHLPALRWWLRRAVGGRWPAHCRCDGEAHKQSFSAAGSGRAPACHGLDAHRNSSPCRPPSSPCRPPIPGRTLRRPASPGVRGRPARRCDGLREFWPESSDLLARGEILNRLRGCPRSGSWGFLDVCPVALGAAVHTAVER